jgi:hypothetical protein
MTGIPFVVQRENGRGQIERKTIYLRSRRRGPAGEKMRLALREYNQALLEQSRCAMKAGTIMAKLAGEPTLAEMEAVEREQLGSVARAQELGAKSLELAEQIAEQALADNYEGPAREEILDELTDKELTAIVSSIELGAMPNDFFQFLDTQQKRSSSAASGDASGQNSLQPGSAAKQSSAGK